MLTNVVWSVIWVVVVGGKCFLVFYFGKLLGLCSGIFILIVDITCSFYLSLSFRVMVFFSSLVDGCSEVSIKDKSNYFK